MKKLTIFVGIITIFSIIITVFLNIITPKELEAAVYTWGSKGSVVNEIQTKLKEWKYYTGNVNGNYGYKTWLAVRKFQNNNKLLANGIAGGTTLDKMGIFPSNIASVAALAQGSQKIYSWGSTGDIVKQIQRKLKQWGYYTGNVDGNYGYKTWLAVRRFQSKNRTKIDGIVGTDTLNKLGIQIQKSGGSVSTDKNINILASLINGEARGESYLGQVAVGAVVLNRTRTPEYPNTLAGVIYQPGAFDAVRDGQINLSPSEQAYKAARDVLNGWDPTGGCTFYWNPATATSKWIWSKPIVMRIGKHVFAKK